MKEELTVLPKQSFSNCISVCPLNDISLRGNKNVTGKILDARHVISTRSRQSYFCINFSFSGLGTN